MNKLFGTDGIRGVAGRYPLTAGAVTAIGRAAGEVLRRAEKGPRRVLIVRDTRYSGPGIVKALSKGLRAEGIDVFDAGVLCTPAVAYLVKAHRFSSGVVVSASHNPPAFNGIKFFTSVGRKWPDAWEQAVERRMRDGRRTASTSERGRMISATQLADDYERFVLGSVSASFHLRDLRIAIDCANGANSVVGPEVFRRLGARIFVTGNKPNGRNINVECGSQHVESLASLVRRNRCHFGVAFDGDGDRVIFVDEAGREIDGDYVIALLAKTLKERRRLKRGIAVVTVMANLGLRKALRRIGVRVVETPVGDRYVSEAMRRHGAVLGGEQSGHIILGDYLPSGDGLLTAVQVTSVFAEKSGRFSRLAGVMRKFPQVLLNVRVREKRPLSELDGVEGRIGEIGRLLGKDGRILVRYSGTEPLLRIMIEGPNKALIKRFATDLASRVEAAG